MRPPQACQSGSVERGDVDAVALVAAAAQKPSALVPAIQRLKIALEAVSGVRSKPLTPFEIKRNFGAQVGRLGVCNRIVAGHAR